jgi:hypothetical protein
MERLGPVDGLDHDGSSLISMVGVVVVGFTLSVLLSSSSSAGKLDGGGVGARSVVAFDFLPPLLRGRIAPAQPFLRFFFLSFLLFLDLHSSFSEGSGADSEPRSDEEPPEGTLRAVSEELELAGRALVGDEAPTKGSRPKNDHRFARDGLGSGRATFDVSATSSRAGIELRLLGMATPAGDSPSPHLSRTAPAVLGRESVVSRVDVSARGAGLSLPLGELAETMEEMLPDKECPGRAVATLDVSLETSDNGRGMNSNVSEKPTRVRVGGLEGNELEPEGISGRDLADS